MNDPATASLAWRRLARRTAARLNLGWWLDRLAPALTLTSLFLAALILLLRSTPRFHGSEPQLAWAAGAILAAAGAWAWLQARPRFLGESEGLVRLEDQLSLRNALTAASHGVAAWPEPPSGEVSAGLAWNWPRVAAPFAVAGSALAAALLLPLASGGREDTPAPSEPLAWAQMEQWLDLLEEESVLDSDALEEAREKVDELRRQPEEEWFSHSGLEAADTLRHSLQQQISQLGAELALAERDLDALQNFSSHLNEETKEMLLAEYDQALQNLALSGLPLNPELLEALQGIDPAQLAQGQMSGLSAEELNQLREALKQAAGACQACAGGGKGEGEDGLPGLGEGDDALLALLRAGMIPGQGGISKGPGPAPLSLAEEATDLGTSRIEGVQNQDFSRAAPGDVLGLGQAEREMDQAPAALRPAGAVDSLGLGGEAVWRETLTPGEQAVLKRYFK